MNRRRLPVHDSEPFPAYVVWELTLACDQRCTHCGSRAADARERELTRDEAIDVAHRLAGLGAREVALIGGEAYLHPDVLAVIEALVDRGVVATMTTGGRGIDADLARRLAGAGLSRASVSIDGVGPTHDRMRATRGGFAAAVAALGHLEAAGIEIAANTNLNRLNRGELEALYEVLRDHRIRSWQVQLTAPLGRAADRVHLVLQPWDLLDVVPRIAALKRRAQVDGILLMPGNNLGYFGPEEALLRSYHPGGRDHFAGCQAGKFLLGIESDGAVKGCPSLQTASYVGGNLRETPLEVLWKDSEVVGFSRHRSVEDLWGFCRSCVFAETCMGGCTFTAHSIMGRPGNNPYCHYRARQLAAVGKRERLVPAEAAPGTPFDNGRFELVEEALDAPDPRRTPAELVRLRAR